MKNIAIDFEGVMIMSSHIVTIGPVVSRKDNKKKEYFYQLSLTHGSIHEYSNESETIVTKHRETIITNTKD